MVDLQASGHQIDEIYVFVKILSWEKTFDDLADRKFLPCLKALVVGNDFEERGGIRKLCRFWVWLTSICCVLPIWLPIT